MTSDPSQIPKSIAIVGASARAAAFSVLRTGRSAVAADLFADADLLAHCEATRISPYPEGLVDWLAATEVDAWLYTGALENYPDLVDRLSSIRPLLGNCGQSLRRCRDPLELQRVFAENDLHFPETRTSCAGLPRDGTWLQKTYRGSCGSGVWVHGEKELRQQDLVAEFFFQKRVEGRAVSVVYALSDSWTATLGMTAQWVGCGVARSAQFQYAGSLGFHYTIPSAIEAQIAKLAQMLASQFQLRGLVGVDLVLESDRAWIVEINPRYTASVEVVERNSGVSAIAAHVAACTGISCGSKEHAPPADRLHGKAILYAKQEVAISRDFFSWAMAEAGHELDSGLADIPVVGSTIAAGQPALTVFASTRAPEIESELRRRIAEVEMRLYRSDI